MRNSVADDSQRAQPAAAQLRATLFDADGEDRELDAAQIAVASLSEQQLLWVDLCGEDPAPLDQLIAQLGLADHAAAVRAGLQGEPRVENFGEWFLIHATAIAEGDGEECDAARTGQGPDISTSSGNGRHTAQNLAIVSGHNFVLTLHNEPLRFLDELRERERADTKLGVLSAESFTASLLDWQLATYFDAVSRFEAAVDRLEITLLSSRRQRECLPELAQLRRVVSRLRRQLAPHRNLFAAMERPDFRPTPGGTPADRHFSLLRERFEHAMDAVENARDLVVGSFELFATRTAQRTNDTMRVLTFFTVLLGSLAVLAGVLGMNFTVPFFDTGAEGFWIAITGMSVLALVALGVARARRWI
ncbi:MAG: hypothetical protein LC715_01840 [Gammaproteobacteria bacterium]|nr:hypothetical protein [Gammaproteobacteria bacterium]